MSEGPTTSGRWGKKRRGFVKAQLMREAKKLKMEGERHDNESNNEEEERQEPEQSALGECPAAEPEEPAPAISDISLNIAEELEDRELEEDPDGDAEEEDEYTNPQEAFDDFMLTLTRDQRKMLSAVLYESFIGRQKMSKMDAAQESASITGLFLFSIT